MSAFNRRGFPYLMLQSTESADPQDMTSLTHLVDRIIFVFLFVLPFCRNSLHFLRRRSAQSHALGKTASWNRSYDLKNNGNARDSTAFK